MTDENQEREWRRIANAAKTAGAGKEPDQGDEAPAEFVSRMRELRSGLWSMVKLVFWRRWSLVAVAVAIVVYLVFYFVVKTDPPSSIPSPEPPAPPAS